MARRRTSTIAFDAIAIEGALIAPDMFSQVAAIDAGEQQDIDYETPPGLKLRDEIGRYFRIGEALWATFDRLQEKDAGGAVTVNFVTQLLTRVFGFVTLAPAEAMTIGGRPFPVRHAALDGRVPLVIAASPDGIDRSLPQFGDGVHRRSATLLLQESLNASDSALYGLVSDGRTLRLMRANTAMTRPAWIEADLSRIFGQHLFADFSALWLLIHQSRFGKAGSPPSDCALERWRDKGREQGVKARERLRDGVEQALKILGEGFLQHRDNAALVQALETGALDEHGYFQELLRIVYRFIFLFTAEDRGLLRPKEQDEAPEAKLYAEGYSLARLRTKAVRSLARDRHHDFWEGARIVFRGLARGEKRLALPALGGLFAPDRTPHLDQARIENGHLLAAVEHLAWMRQDGARMRVNWRDMETQELGSVYESLLELTPRASASERTFAFAEGAETAGNARKTSGSYYTPDPLVQLLLDSAIDPVVEETIAKNPGREVDALLELDILDPACGSGHFLLAAARRLAARIAQLRSPGSPSAEDYRHALREVARHCLYGVDRNPMAVELCKVALWIETVEPGKPLSFLDNRIRQGDSLIGIFDLKMLAGGIPDEAYKVLTCDDKAVASHYRKLNKAQRDGKKDQHRFTFAGAPNDLADAFVAVDAMPEDDVDEVAAKAVADAAARGKTGWWQLKTACDLFVTAFFVSKTGKLPDRSQGIRGDTDQRIPTTDVVWRAAQAEVPDHQLVARAVDVAGQASAFHWPLEFPDVMRKGGFDAVVGNPPWERIKLQEQEFFASRAPEIALAANKAARDRLIAKLADAPEDSAERRLHDGFLLAKRNADAASLFARESGRYPCTGTGDVNTYALFAELFAQAALSRAGMIVPTGIATDATTATFFAQLALTKRIAQLLDFENREHIFPAVYYRVKFCLLTLARRVEQTSFAFFLTKPSQATEAERRFVLSADQIACFNPNTKTAPIFRSRADAELNAKIYARVPVLINETNGASTNPWQIDFSRLFDMANDSALFRTSAQILAAGGVRDGIGWRVRSEKSGGTTTHYVPLYEAKMISAYDHRSGSYGERGDARGFRVLPDTTANQYAEIGFEPEPFYFVPLSEVVDRLPKAWNRLWLLAFKDVTAVTNERTAIFAAIPRVGVGHSAPLMFPMVEPPHVAALLACLNSLVLDYCARTKVGGVHLTYSYLKQFPILPPSAFAASDLAFVVPRVLELSYTSSSMHAFANDLGFNGLPFRWNEERRAWLRAELDAYYARLYGLTRADLLYILDPGSARGDNYPSETFRALKDSETRRFGEYRTARLVMQAWDELAAKG
ncbi:MULTISPECIES: Eco57I restriction-modification methylase domain-containing protein [unclassified Bradyrhizobium]|uniref:Eco57I restriction-modification methylase domain-containing protein n=1 Tax=unclassified Bradyrhizobium TaxID=2631580 RepID=UPI002916AB26|nr:MULTISPECIES: N-6 DNA methylase [unclassified Bradyrhizobium]